MQRANVLLSHLLADSTEESSSRHLHGVPCAESPPPGQDAAKDAASADDKADEEDEAETTNAPELEVQIVMNAAKQRYGLSRWHSSYGRVQSVTSSCFSCRYELLPLPNRVSFDQGFFYTMRAIELVLHRLASLR
jgi:hypothetical protein